jgi:hypothetical protein
MIQIIAVHSAGTMPRVMELETSGLDHVQAHALQHLPRAPSGVPELRALGKEDGELRFRFHVPPAKLSPEFLPELLTLWDAKRTEASLKLLAKAHKSERDAASAAGLWKEGSDKRDLNAMHAQATPQEAIEFTAALATVVQSKKAPATPKRLPKPKLVASVIAATTEIDPLTGERKDNISTVDGAVATLRARELVKSMSKTADQAQQFDDPLELARLKDLAAAPSLDQPAVPQSAQGIVSQAVDAGAHTAIQPETLGSPASQQSPPAKPETTDRALKAIEHHKSGKSKGPRLLEMGPQDLFMRLDQERAKPVPQKGSAPAPVTVSANEPEDTAGMGRDREYPKVYPLFYGAVPEFSSFEQSEQGDPFPAGQTSCDWESEASAPVSTDDAEGTGGKNTVDMTAVPESAVHATEPAARSIDWSGLGSFRLSCQLNSGQALVLSTGEVFEALAHIDLQEPLAVQVQWLQDAAREADEVLPDQVQLDFATDWMRQQLTWRSKELQRWLGKGDLVSPEHMLDVPVAKKGKLRPAGWVATAMDMAGLAQQISMDIAMLDLCASEVDRALTGMPAWAIDAMQQMRAFEKLQAENPINEQSPEPGADFRDSWRAELLRIDRWCAHFKQIRIARQIGLFGSSADQKLLLRLEMLINRAKDWQRAPAQASRVLAVWLAFVLSLDHSAVAAKRTQQAAQKEVSHA